MSNANTFHARGESVTASAATYSAGGTAFRSMIGVPRIPMATPPSRPKLVGRPRFVLHRIVPAGIAGGPGTSNALIAYTSSLLVAAKTTLKLCPA